MTQPFDATQFFSDYMQLTGAAHLGPEKSGDPQLIGKRLGLLNGSSWITAWSNYFGRRYLPGVHLVNVGNEAVQLSFMQAHTQGLPCPPQANIDRFVRYAIDLVELAQVTAVMITCSTMNRAYPEVARALEAYGVPVIQIDQPMMERAVEIGGRTLVIATHGPTVASTQVLLQETAARLDKKIAFDGETVEAAWEQLAEGNITAHNQIIADVIETKRESGISSVVLAQLSMAAFLFSYPDPQAVFGLPVLTSGQCGFERAREILLAC